MSESSLRRSLLKRTLLVLGGVFAFVLIFTVCFRIAVYEVSDGIAQSRATGLSPSPWDRRSMWSTWGLSANSGYQPMLQKGSAGPWISRSADLRARTSAFDHSVAALHQVVSTHHGYLEDLRTESRSGYGRALAATVSVPSNDFDTTLADLKSLGRVEGLSEAGEDSAVRLATAARQLDAARTNLSRLQRLQRERKGELRDVVALEKDIAQANEAVLEAERQHESLYWTVAQAHIRVTLLEDYRTPLEVSLASCFLPLRNSFVEGVNAIFSSVSLVLGVLFEFGFPLIFWLALLFMPARLAWRRFRRTPATNPAEAPAAS
jgi:Domain of unknown function (DUF4349)